VGSYFKEIERKQLRKSGRKELKLVVEKEVKASRERRVMEARKVSMTSRFVLIKQNKTHTLVHLPLLLVMKIC
jgi:hypothetical protein